MQFKRIGNVEGRADRWLQSHCTYWSADGRMKLIFWGRQCRHISSSRCKAILSRVAGLIWSIWTGSGLQPQPIVLCQMGWPIHHAFLHVSPLWYLHCHWYDKPTQWWIADSMHYDKTEGSVCTVHSASYFAQLGTNHSYKASLFNMVATVWGPCGQYTSTCLINVASPTWLIQSSSPLTNKYSTRELNQMSETYSFHDVHSKMFRRKGTPQWPLLQCCTFIFLWVLSAMGNQLQNQWNEVHQIVSLGCNKAGVCHK